MPNSLQKEKSPYLKQHENNPVNWVSWSQISLEKAKIEKKPIFLSIGYSSCHWCHVMAHESFENEETAKLLNEKFINIKVDREERPDLDSIFQKSLSILTGAQGGWPLSMFLDENGVPFTGGTYFPPKKMQGRPSFNQVIMNVSKVYKENREKIITQAPHLKNVFKGINRRDSILKQDLEPFAKKILEYFDKKKGGFKGAPKFPQFYIYDAILYFYNKNKLSIFYEAVKVLLENISSKGIYDHLMGGISRYTVDENWIIPHFEKMLYDNILFIDLMNKFIKLNNSEYFKKKLKQTILFINSEFISEDFLLGSAYDADSENEEGKYYTWSYEDLNKILGKNLEIFKKKYLITKEGNFEGKNIIVENTNYDQNSEDERINYKNETILLNERKKRIKPFFDNKIQTDLNCFWLYTSLYSSLILNDNDLYRKSLMNSKKIIEKLKDDLVHCYGYNDNQKSVFLEDFAYFAQLLITVYEFDNDKNALSLCKKVMRETWEKFYNNEYNLLQKNIVNKNDLFVNSIDIFDVNIPNGNSIFLSVCVKLKNIFYEEYWSEKIEILSKSLNSYLSYNYSQMFSHIKILDVCENNISITLHGNRYEIDKYKLDLIKMFMGNVSIIYGNEETNFFAVVCKNQTCSDKLKSFAEIKEYIKNYIDVR